MRIVVPTILLLPAFFTAFVRNVVLLGPGLVGRNLEQPRRKNNTGQAHREGDDERRDKLLGKHSFNVQACQRMGWSAVQ